MNLKLPKKRVVVANAPLLNRLVAFFIDLFILNVTVMSPFRQLVQKIVPEATFREYLDYIYSDQNLVSMISIITIVMTLLALLYFSILEFKIGQTPGKILLKLHVVSLNKDVRFWQYIIRSLFIIPTVPFIILWIIDPIYIFFNKDNQRFTEKLSRTKVVSVYNL